MTVEGPNCYWDPQLKACGVKKSAPDAHANPQRACIVKECQRAGCDHQGNFYTQGRLFCLEDAKELDARIANTIRTFLSG